MKAKLPTGSFKTIDFVRGEPLSTVPVEEKIVKGDSKMNLKRGEFRSSLVDYGVC